jgi:thiol-disulfide isomerase/thioredoxin
MKRANLILLIAAVTSVTVAFTPFQKKITEGTNIGNKAPDLVFNDPNGKQISLSSLKGKIVLIDFWASWCIPCRRENPFVVNAYNKYKDDKFDKADGFTIFSVSLDENADAWKKAIQADNLLWPYHVSDFGKWNSAAARKYYISSIPNNFLINGDGIIVAKYLRGAQLEAALDRLKGKPASSK